MADTLHLQIITPDKLLVREDADQVQIPGKNGYLGILPGHAPLITELMIGEISYTQGGDHALPAVAWGFAEVLPDKVTILADIAERAEDIDVKRAQEAKAKAEEALRQAAPDLDYDAVQYAQRRAEVRLEVAAHAGQATPRIRRLRKHLDFGLTGSRFGLYQGTTSVVPNRRKNPGFSPCR